MGEKMSDDVVDEVVRLYLAGWKMKDIVAMVGSSKDAVRWALKKRGVWKRGKVTREVEEKIVDLFLWWKFGRFVEFGTSYVFGQGGLV